jgi:hypothetical protein
MNKTEKIRQMVVMTLVFTLVSSMISFMAHAEPIEALEIHAPSWVIEEESFLVTITCNNSTIANATVVFLNETYYTNLFGQVTLLAPMVDEDTWYGILASKDGYLSDSSSILVKDIIPQLVIDAPSSVIEEDDFLAIVTADGIPIMGARVVFLNESYYTDSNGSVLLTAPRVDEDSWYDILASKDGYISDGALILVRDQNESLPGDFNGDCHVDFTDFTILASAYGSSQNDSNYNPKCDMNSDGYINFTDFTLFAGQYGKSCDE